MASNVNLIDPLDVNINTAVINGIPQYQDMFIFAELYGVRKGRTVLVKQEGSAKYGIEQTGLESTTRVNFMGINQTTGSENNKNPNFLNFTTNYYDGSNGNNVQYEGFGMTSIKVVINSSFIPQVNIQFVDIRGLAFFNRENSPYRILFDFPPPIFYLTIKGYYGKSLSYQLHLVKYTTEFKAENGNFVIDAQFVATTFAPLTDVLFRYIINFPLIDNPQSLNPDPKGPPVNTYGLIVKLRNLYSSISKDIKSSNETKEYDDIMNMIANNNNSINALASYKDSLESNTDNQGLSYMFIKDVSQSRKSVVPKTSIQIASLPYDTQKNYTSTKENTKANLIPITTLLSYDEIIKKIGVNSVLQDSGNKQRLIIGYFVGQNISDALPTTNAKKISDMKAALIAYRRNLIESAKNNGIDIDTGSKDINDPEAFDNNYSVITNSSSENTSTYVGMDVTSFYSKIYNNKTSLKNKKTVLTKSINTKINQKILENLGMRPSIYNIFKIILDDVDSFFEKIRSTSRDAENNHHNIPDYKKLIVNDGTYRDVGREIIGNNAANIFAFPLVVEKQFVTGGEREVRKAPIEISKKLPKPFPEIKLVEDFIDTFNSQQNYTELSTMRANQDDQGRNKWIPISPIDSVLGTNDMESPYIGVDTSDGGGSTTQPINMSSDNRINQVLKKMLDRYYVLSQSSLPANFYKDDKTAAEYIKLYAETEGMNLVASIFSSDYGEILRKFSEKYASNPTAFYTYLDSNLKDYYDFPELKSDGTPTKEYIEISKGDNGKVYVDKDYSGYRGCSLLDDKEIVLRQFDDGSSSPIDTFHENTRRKFFTLNIKSDSSYKFTNENVIYIEDDMKANFQTDLEGGDETRKFEGTKLFTRFVAPSGSVYVYPSNDDQATNVMVINGKKLNRIDAINSLIASGNSYFLNKSGFGAVISKSAVMLENGSFANPIDTWISILSRHDTEIYTDVISQSTPLGAAILLSNFGYSLSPFNLYPRNLNQYIFSVPAAIEVPAFIPAYLGALIGAETNGLLNELKTFFTTGAGKNLPSSGLYMFADIADAKNILSDSDKELFRTAYNTFNDEYLGIRTALKETYDKINDPNIGMVRRSDFKNNDSGEIEYFQAKEKAYKFLLYPQTKGEEENSGLKYNSVMQPLLEGTAIINFSEISFKKPAINQSGYISIKEKNDTNKTIKDINNAYFSKFFSTVSQNIAKKNDELKEQEKEANKRKGDEDIVTQTYYSFKNINDKWLCNPSQKSTYGYPFNTNNKHLIDSFAFVDRALNPIGDTIINAEILAQMFEDTNLSVFSALSQLLSLNGFEFFPLQNLMSYNNQDWEDSFKINVNGDAANSPAFVCMFIGGTASYPSGMDNDFKDDSIPDLSKTTATDFQTKEPESGTASPEDSLQETNYGGFPWREVRAFRVRFGEQNQSMFTDIKIDSKEYPETNESIQILARLAGDSKGTTPIPKGQNLYNLYENRAYKATIAGMGNAMIQPTQYFQLENVPLFNGAYIILSVEHSIEPNRMMTNFSGTKILRYPVPRVMNPAALIGFDGGDSEATNVNMMSSGDLSKGVGSKDAAEKARYNSMYKGFEIL